MTDKYFKNSAGSEMHVIDENFLFLLPAGLIEISQSEYAALVADSQIKSDSEKLSEFKAEVQAALDASDLVALRAFKAGVAFGAEWTSYDASLRELKSVIVFSDDLALPTKPATYPS